MKRLIVNALTLLVLLPFMAGANQEGVWLAPSKPGYLFLVIEGDVNSQETASMTVIHPSGMSDIYFGPDTFDFGSLVNRVNLAPLRSASDMRATWTAGERDGQITVTSCTQNCLWPAGDTKALVKAYGEGVNVGGGGSGGGTPGTGGMWAGTGTNADGSRYEACFNVAADGSKITATGSSCDDNNALDIEIDDVRCADGDQDDINIGYPSDIPINNGSFEVVDWTPPGVPPFVGLKLTVRGTISGNTASGTLRSVTAFGDDCTGNWSATQR